MCPSYRVTRDETHLTRGRANTLRLALTGQLGAAAMASDAVADAMALCVSCKACRRECPTGVDMAKMKIEVLAARFDRNGLTRRDWLIAELPRYAPHGRAVRAAGQSAQHGPGAAPARRTHVWASPPRARCPPGGAMRSATARRCVHTGAPARRSAAVRRYVQSLVRAGESARRPARADRCRLSCPHAGRYAAGRCAAAAATSPPAWSSKARSEARRTLEILGGELPVIGLEPPVC